MNKLHFLLFVFLGLFCSPLQNCPTCVGKVHEKSPPFFTNECYEEMNIEPEDFKQTDTLSLLQNIKGEQ